MLKSDRLEKGQYAPVKKYLESIGCDRKHLWMAGQGQAIRLSVNDPHSRTPDVAGASRSADGWRTHIVEAKRDVGGGAAIQLGLAQLRAVKRYADFLYFSLEQSDWDKRSESAQKTLMAELASDGFGLLLVKGKTVSSAQLPTETPADPDLRNELLEWLEVDPRSTVRLETTLGKDHALAAATTVAFVAQCVWELRDVLTEEFPKAKLPKDADYWLLFSELLLKQPYIGLGAGAEVDSLYFEGDPFGYYAKDGMPVIWVWCPCEKKPTLTKPAPGEGSGWFVYGEDEHGRDHLAPWGPAAIADLVNQGCRTEWHVAARVAVTGRTPEQVREDCRKIVRVVKGAAFKQLVK